MDLFFPIDNSLKNYIDPIADARNCRLYATLFDFSFISSVCVQGSNPIDFLDFYLIRNIRDLDINRVRYTLTLNSSGDVEGDLTIWRLKDRNFEVMSGRRIDVDDILSHQFSGCIFKDKSNTRRIYAVQGPESLRLLSKFCQAEKLTRLKYYQFCDLDVAGIPSRVARIGYTGERGFEIIVDHEGANDLWEELSGVIPVAGFATADILRIEAGFILFCNECKLKVKPYELGLDKFTSKPLTLNDNATIEFVCFQAEAETKKSLWQHPSSMPERPGAGMITITSACYSPVAESVLGLGFVNKKDIQKTIKFIDPLGQFDSVSLCSKPFVDKSKLKVHGGWSDNLLPVY